MWILPSSISGAFARESAGLTLPSSSPATTAEFEPAAYLQSSGTPTLRKSSDRVWKTRPWSHALFGAAICESSRQNAFEEWWTQRCLGSHAKTFHVQEKAMGFTGREAGCTSTSSTPFARWDAASYSWRTSERSLFEGLMLFSGRWPKSGSLRNGRVSRRPPLVLRTSESDGSAWPTPRAGENGSDSGSKKRLRQGPSPGLKDMAKHWPTIKATDGSHGGPNQRDSSGAPSLEMAAGNWSTPAASDGKRGTSPYSQKEIDRPEGKPMTLSKDVAMWPTPAARDHKSGAASDETFQSNSRPLNEAACRYSLQGQEEIGAASRNGFGQASLLRWIVARLKPRSGELSGWLLQAEIVASDERLRKELLSLLPTRRRLNPAFVDWLMGAPSPFWTRAEPINCGVLEMASWLRRLAVLISSLCKD